MQQQVGGIVCGLMAIAASLDILMGNDPSTIHYNQDLMRDHFLFCLKSGKMVPFPRKTGSHIRRNNSIIGKIWLLKCCKLPRCLGTTVKCRNNACKLEVHKICIGWNKLPTRKQRHWLCNKCKK